MRTLILLACSLAAATALAASAGAASTENGMVSIDEGRGIVGLDLRGSVLGRLRNGTIRVTDLTPRDRFGEIVFGRELVEEVVSPRTVVYRGQGIRFRMLGGAYKITIRGAGIELAAVGRGTVSLDGEPRLLGDVTGLYSVSGVDCGIEPALCDPLPDEPVRFTIGAPPGP
jgi:hypothetical protein